MKRCPDCAEDVLAEARKCRYCGYRFDAVRRRSPAPPGSDLQSLFARLLTRPARAGPDPPLTEVVAAWGIEVAPGEEVTFLAFGQTGGRYGYLVVTGDRFLFVEHEGSKVYRQTLSHPRAGILSVQLGTGRRHRITVRGEGFAVEIGGLTRDMAQAAQRHLSRG